MSSDAPIHDLPASNLEEAIPNDLRRGIIILDDTKYGDPALVSLPSNDMHTWYYPSHGYSSDDNHSVNAFNGNWGRKTHKHAKWVKKGKMISWRQGREDWENEGRARKRIKLLLQNERKEDTPVFLPHLRSPSPPLMAPYPAPSTQHYSYTSFVMDKAVTASFRSRLLDELEGATNGLIQGEATMRRALGRLWQVMSETPHETSEDGSLVPKREDVDAEEGHERVPRLPQVPDITAALHNLFLASLPDADAEQPQYPEMHLEQLEKAIVTLRELQDDGREYVERLEEIRDGLGDARVQRAGVWDLIRKKAIRDLQDMAAGSTV